MKIGRFVSEFLKGANVKAPTVVTIRAAETRQFKNDDPKKAERQSLVIFFKELDQGVVLCKESILQLEQICGSDDTDQWIGKKVTMFFDPNIRYQGKLVGGIRFRAEK